MTTLSRIDTTKRSGRFSAAVPSIDPGRYRRLLGKALPKVIETEAENRATLEIINALIARGDDKRSREENALLELLVTLVESFERARYRVKGSTPREMLLFLMESNNLKAAEVGRILGSRSRVSEILSGKRGISKGQARRLGEHFQVSPSLFL